MTTINHPPTIINAYLASKLDPLLKKDTEVNGSQNLTFNQDTLPTFGTTYFFPTLPTQIDALTETFPNSNEVFGVYDRMFKMRRAPFPYIKCEQLLYYFYAVGDDAQKKLIITQQQILELLDNQDDSGKDINDWSRKNPTKWSGQSTPVFFHYFKIYQLEETRDIIDFGTARTYAGNKIIIDYDYHLG
jgi:hypothetical protein